MKLYVIRHGETEQGKNKIIANVKEPLNFTGINQAIKPRMWIYEKCI